MKILYGDEWRAFDLTGLSVGVLVPPDQAARIVPAVVGSARAVKVFQDSPVWVVPVAVPRVGPVVSLARLHLRMAVRDAWTRRLLTPGRFGSREVVVSPSYYRALEQPHCKLVAWPVYAIVEHGVRTAEGIEHRLDVLITANPLGKAKAA
ncbi:FAD-dependent oxidoreductase [Nocardioides antri]|uniref:FAD-dependent oxidoreductase n=1 Tax=Nocardioides antri TaxID=2607659 RepID=A0A5B1M3K5_9ACTN|nr:FAD-dependent oxidoreductase [Nocardioides antri]KAA1426387.1 FAD-dependent oxidoreductase [Nocardioides antri]